MATSREEFLRPTLDRNAERLATFRLDIEAALRAAQFRGDTSFGVEIPDSLVSHPLTGIITEYENPEAGWTVEKSKTGNTTMLFFS